MKGAWHFLHNVDFVVLICIQIKRTIVLIIQFMECFGAVLRANR